MSAPERLTSNDTNSVMTQVADPKPGWWSSLLAQLTGRSLDRAVEVDDVEETDPDETESSAPDTTDVADDVPTVIEPLEAELVEETPPPDDPESKPADSVELEVLDAELVDDEPDEPAEVTVPEVDTAEVPEVEPADPEPEPEPVVVEVAELDITEVDTTAAAVVEEPAVDEPAVVYEAPTPELDASDPEPSDTVFTDPDTPEVETDQAAAVEVEPVEVEPIAGNSDRGPTGPVKDRDDLTVRWLDELRSGEHRQTCGAWESAGTFFDRTTKECTLQVAINTFDIPLGELRNKYGERFIGDVLYRNDVEMQSFKQIADFIERTQLSRSRQKELEMER